MVNAPSVLSAGAVTAAIASLDLLDSPRNPSKKTSSIENWIFSIGISKAGAKGALHFSGCSEEDRNRSVLIEVGESGFSLTDGVFDFDRFCEVANGDSGDGAEAVVV
ncbi:Hypothetical predicted protein [Olea europaea subsp. europaea]|uniref:Uncharacterized protein n=1 Tax=Olea europaea subsp. europaea TaxID=158383 RepID=A0A8S0QAQ1_OLEEU|nr:Hypothetical predicted protein [Olea europaea subsp. europaea]